MNALDEECSLESPGLPRKPGPVVQHGDQNPTIHSRQFYGYVFTRPWRAGYHLGIRVGRLSSVHP